MKYKIQFDKFHRNSITIHLDINLFNFLPKFSNHWRLEDEDDDNFMYDDDTQAPLFLNRIRLIKGIESAYFKKFSIEVNKGELFSWSGIIRRVLADLQITLNHGSRAKKVNSHSLKLFQRRNGVRIRRRLT